MREIKFRAWDTLQGGKFEYWDSETNRFDGIFWTMIKHKSFKEPQQYTGLKDKNGKEVWEGDIIRTLHFMDRDKPQYLYHKVVYSDRYCAYNAINLKNTDELLTTHGNTFLYVLAKASSYEVIGNIYENPELLK